MSCNWYVLAVVLTNSVESRTTNLFMFSSTGGCSATGPQANCNIGHNGCHKVCYFLWQRPYFHHSGAYISGGYVLQQESCGRLCWFSCEASITDSPAAKWRWERKYSLLSECHSCRGHVGSAPNILVVGLQCSHVMDIVFWVLYTEKCPLDQGLQTVSINGPHDLKYRHTQVALTFCW